MERRKEGKEGEREKGEGSSGLNFQSDIETNK
jgi:hypothetical protein